MAASSSSTSSVSSSSLRCTFLISLSLSFAFFPHLESSRALVSPLFLSMPPSSLFAPCPLVSCPYRGILEHSMVHPVLHIMYPTTVFRPYLLCPRPPIRDWTRFTPPAHARPPVGATLMIHERIINAQTSTEVSSPGFRSMIVFRSKMFQWTRSNGTKINLIKRRQNGRAGPIAQLHDW